MNVTPSQEIYQRNLALINEVYPQYMDLLQGLPSNPPYELNLLDERTVTCNLPLGENQTQWINGPENPWQWAENLIKEADWQTVGTFLIMRPGMGYIPFTLYPNMRKGRNAQRMLLVEDKIDLFNLSLQVFDWTDVLRSDRILLILTHDLVASTLDFFKTNPSAILPVLSLFFGRKWGDDEKQLVFTLQKNLQQMSKTATEAAQQYHNELVAYYNENPLATRHKNKVMLVEPEHPYLADPISEAFKQESWTVQQFSGTRRMLRFLNPFAWLVYCREFFPDVLLWMNRNTLSPEGAKNLNGLPIKKVLWFLDNPKRVETTKEELEASDAIFTFDASYLPYLKELGGKDGFYLPTAAGIRPIPECEPDKIWPERTGSPVGFLGALAADRYQDVLTFWTQRDPEFIHILDDIVETYLDDYSVSLEDRYRQSDGINRLPFSGFVVLYLEERCTYFIRLRHLISLKDFGLETYGATEWGNPEWAKEIAGNYSGIMPNYETELPSIYYHTKVNVNVFHVQCINSTNPRIYDVLAAGGFLLTEHRPVIDDEFTNGEHLVTYKTIDELKEKTDYYLSHEKEREAIAREGQTFVLRHATYSARIKKMLNQLF